MLELMNVKKPAQLADEGRRTDAAVNAYAQHRVEQWLQEHPAKSASDLSDELGLANSFVSRLRSKGDGVGWHAARQLARVCSMSLGEFVTEADRFWEERSNAKGVRALNERSGWGEASAKAMRDFGATEDEVKTVGAWRMQLNVPLSADTLWALVQAFRAQSPLKPPRKR